MADRIGVIGGSGLYAMDGLTIREERAVDTPFGNPSDAYFIGEFSGREVVFLPRHGRGHRISAPDVNYRANIYGMKALGVSRIISVSAVGSLKEGYRPGNMVMVDQFFDRTSGRRSTFFDQGAAAHILFADPICKNLSDVVYSAAKEHVGGDCVHRGGAYVCIQGPQLSTRAESLVHRSWGMDVVGMTNLTEAKLAREAEICYATIALITDYDCWHVDDEPFSAEKIVAVFASNVEKAKKTIAAALMLLPEQAPDCACRHALDGAFIGEKGAISPETKRMLRVIAGRVLDRA